MKIIAILIVRDEEDIIKFSLNRFSEQFDEVYVFDTGSIDTTWGQVQALAKVRRNVIPVRKENYLFSDALRGMVFEIARKNLRDGDWFARVDADEIYHTPPREFIRTSVESYEGQVFCQYYDFQPLSKELPKHASVPDLFIEKRLRHYRISPSPGEVRLFKYRSSMIWFPGESDPREGGVIAKRKIPVRHYPARSEEQLKRRAVLRLIMRKENASAWGSPDWHHWELKFEEFLGKQEDPNLLSLEVDGEIKTVDRVNHLSNSQTERNVYFQRLLNMTGLIRVKDMLYHWKKFPAWQPSPLPQVLAEKIKAEYDRISRDETNSSA